MVAENGLTCILAASTRLGVRAKGLGWVNAYSPERQPFLRLMTNLLKIPLHDLQSLTTEPDPGNTGVSGFRMNSRPDRAGRLALGRPSLVWGVGGNVCNRRILLKKGVANAV